MARAKRKADPPEISSFAAAIDDAAKDRRIVPRAISEAFVDHDGGEIGVQHRSAEASSALPTMTGS